MERLDPGALVSPLASAGAAGLQPSELIGALSHALDITEGQPKRHGVRCCWIGMHIGQDLGLDERQRGQLYYMLLLKDLGCSSNAARICKLYLADDLQFKHDWSTRPSETRRPRARGRGRPAARRRWPAAGSS
jgi:hypothetical protein